jgi:hypothetical protein
MMNSSDHVLDSDGELSDTTTSAAAATAATDNTTAKADSSKQGQSKGSKKKRKLQSKSSSSSNSSAKVLKTSTNSPTLSSSNSKSSGNTAASQEVKALQSALHDAKRSLGVKEKKVSVVLYYYTILLSTDVYVIVLNQPVTESAVGMRAAMFKLTLVIHQANSWASQ